MIKTALFDVDGVLLSEERYFDASALTVWEILYSENYLGLAPEKYKTDFTDQEISAIRSTVFQDDQVLKFLKSHGLNANWDMIYLTISYQLLRLLEAVKNVDAEKVNGWLVNEIDRPILMEIGETVQSHEKSIDFSAFIPAFKTAPKDKQGLLNHLDVLAEEMIGVETNMFGKKGSLWSVCEHISQEWYVGDSHVLTSTGRPSVQTGKKGFLTDEKTLCAPEEISALFQDLKAEGVVIGIGTGRPELETIEPFEYLNWLQHFDQAFIATADDVLAAERKFPDGPALAKPHPYTYIMALSGKTKTAEACIAEKLPLENGKETLIVGDSLADLLAARSMGCTFAAVLTGLSGKDARAEFEHYEADYILDNVLEVKDVILSLKK